MGKPKSPTPTDPRETASASTSTNIGTAIANTMMGNVAQVGPGGSLNYSQSGTYSWKDPYTGKSYDVPQFTATTTLSPEMEKIYAGIMSRGGEVVNDLSNANPLDAGQYRQKAEDSLTARQSGQWEADRQRLETQMANQGISSGSRAYSARSDDLNRAINDARLGISLAGSQEAANMAQLDAAQRAAPINELNALLSAGQVSTPQFSMNQPSRIPTTDTAGLINTSYNQAQQNYQNKLGAWNNTWGGLFGLGAAGIGTL